MSRDLAGHHIAHFRLVEKLGEGGMGVVYRATDTKLGRSIALKVLPLKFAGNPEYRRRFLREARSAAALSHQNVATVYEVGDSDEHVYIAMELIDGESLRERLRDAMLVADALPIAAFIAAGLAEAHEHGIVHRDLKPDNVMISSKGVVKLLDFGIAQVRDVELLVRGSQATEQPQITQEGQVLGTPAYMSPEQARGELVDARTDVFAFGVMLYEMLAGQRPFDGSTAAALLFEMMTTEPASIMSRNPDVSPALESLVNQCLAKRAEDRLANGRRIVTALEALAAHVGSGIAVAPRRVVIGADTARGAEVSLLSTQLASTPEPEPSVAGVGTQRPPSQRRGLTILTALALTAATVGGVYAYRMKAGHVLAPPPSASTSPSQSVPPLLRLIDLPPPSSKNEKALATYAEGIRERYDGVSASFLLFFDAVALDPMLASANVRIAEVFVGVDQLEAARGCLRDALAHRETLSSRDAEIVNALSPVALRDPPDWTEAVARMRSVLAARPSDQGVKMDLLDLISREAQAGTRPQQAALAEEMIRADPSFGPAQEWRAAASLAGGRLEDAQGQARACLDVAPRSTLCLSGLASAASALGACATVLDAGQRWTALTPNDAWGYVYSSNALLAMSAPDAAVDEPLAALLRSANIVRGRLVEATGVRFDLARRVRSGQFLQTDALAEKSYELWKLSLRPDRAVSGWKIRIEAAVESGDVRRAGALARSYRARYRGSPQAEVGEDPSMFFLAVERLADLTNSATAIEGEASWAEAWRARLGPVLPPAAWIVGDAVLVEGRAGAERAIASRPSIEDLSVHGDADLAYRVGHVSLLAGRTEEAIPLLEEAARTCMVEEADPFSPILAAYDLGQALEEHSYKAGACAAYAKVLERWGHATPRSVTAERSRHRWEALQCAREPSR